LYDLIRQKYKTFRHVQEKIQNISPIKQRILFFVEGLGISKREFYDITGISRGTLESQTGITEETLTKFFAIYSNIDPVWVLTGKGSPEKYDNYEVVHDVNIVSEPSSEILQQLISRKIDKIERLSAKVERLKNELNTLKRR
jgi:hypothetical protein